MKDQSDVYRYINPSKNTPHFYELLDRDRRHLYFMQFRVVKIKTAENTYEYLITNLPYSFTMEESKKKKNGRMITNIFTKSTFLLL